MKVGIIGQGSCGVFTAIMLKQLDRNIDIIMFDHNDKTNKKMLATGNGRCNLGNLRIDKNSYNNEFASQIIRKFPIMSQRNFYESIGLETRIIDNLVYPFSLSSNQVVAYLNKLLKEYKVKLINNSKVDDYIVDDNCVTINAFGKIYKVDKLIVATGGISSSSLGSDGAFNKILKAHNYEFTSLKAGLTPIIVNENVKGIENERAKCKVSLFINNKLSYEEIGEVLFKKNGLSGISIMNCSSIISRSKSSSKIKIVLDLFPDISSEILFEKFKKYSGLAGFSFLEGVFTIKMADYIRKNSNAKNLYKFDIRDIRNIAKYCKNMEFTYKENYSFDNSQVTVGGVDVLQINENLESKLESNVFFGGEVLDIDGLCGGYNLMLACACAKVISDAIAKK
ncbi:MAG: aminoacetone oxidase family FAD-binding enzyme [Candidatus Onthovivens sp.]|nr:aminoacetone oxidase family FAD-binding enzyme [Candidatus Onthovivens sp.]